MLGTGRLLTLSKQVCSLPTASFHEHRVLGFLREHAARLGLPAAQDRWGNLHVRYRHRRRGPAWVLIAHADHPGFVITHVAGQRCRARWFGRVAPAYFRGGRVRVHPVGARSVGGRITRIRQSGTTARVETLWIDAAGALAPGDLGTWDLPAFRRVGNAIITRAADDLIGCALLAATLESLVRAEASAAVTVVYTRAEEAGLLGATALARAAIIPGDHPILSIETSRELPCARRGAGPVVRLGDKIAACDPGIQQLILAAAAELSARHPGFRVQRCLMDGGTCEASSFAAFGYRTAGLAIPLANYHNMGPRGVAAERIDLRDLRAALALLFALATRRRRPGEGERACDPARLVAALARAEAQLRASVSAAPVPWDEAR
ncbi:MAG: hypothetical protein KAY32_02870 [Candidatus Eisenbacteria sp.]|nr:hypothetical protein [Candidatus Eisenbacteria bacterium]